jgi:hypothetical protein
MLKTWALHVLRPIPDGNGFHTDDTDQPVTSGFATNDQLF